MEDRNLQTGLQISIHAPHAGCDAGMAQGGRDIGISIHAPHAGCDYTDGKVPASDADFNPRTPCGVRLDAARHKL